MFADEVTLDKKILCVRNGNKLVYAETVETAPYNQNHHIPTGWCVKGDTMYRPAREFLSLRPPFSIELRPCT